MAGEISDEGLWDSNPLLTRSIPCLHLPAVLLKNWLEK